MQVFNLLIDTGSSITWVPIKDSKDLFPLTHHYDPSLSSTSIKKSEEPFEIVYGSGSANGSYYSDKITYAVGIYKYPSITPLLLCSCNI